MTNIVANPEWKSVRILERDEVALGGVGGNMNEQATALVARTELLMEEKASRADLEAIAGGFEPFLTEAALLASVPTVPKKAAKALDTRKIWYWNGSSWTDTGLSELDQAVEYIDSLIKDVTTLATGTDIKSIISVGTYLLLNTNTYIGLPANLDQSESIVMKVSAGTGAYVYQEVHKLSEPYRVWRKLLQISNGIGTWTEPFYEYQKLVDAVDPTTITESGYYVLTNGVNLPAGFSGSALMQVERFGGFTVRTLIQSSNPRLQWQKVGAGIWVEHTPFNLSVSQFNRDYAYRGLKTAVDINTLIDDGRYLVNGAFTNGASWITDTQYIDVKVYGSFLIQQATSTNTINQIAQRRGSITSGVTTWQAWEKVGGSSGANGSSLSGKTIAFIGDSIVEGGDYPNRIGDRYGATIHKFGFGGCRASKYTTSPLGYDKQCLYNIAKCINTGDYSSLIAGAEYTRDNHSDDNTPQANAMAALNWNNVNILVIAFGTNDWTSPNGLGTSLVADSTGSTFKGAMCYAIEQIQSKYPHLQVVILGMSFRLRVLNGVQDPNVHSDNTPNDLGEYLNQYQQALLEVGNKYHVPAFDMYKNSGLNSMTYANFLTDGVHPKPVSGYQHFANKYGSFMNASM